MHRKYLAAHRDGTLMEEVSKLAKLIKEEPVDLGCSIRFQPVEQPSEPSNIHGLFCVFVHLPEDDIS